MNLTVPLINHLREQGYMCRIVSIKRLKDLHDMIQNYYREGLLNKDLYDLYFSAFISNPPAEFNDAQSLIILARKDPPTQITFNYEGKLVQTIVPPTYLHAREHFEHARTALTEFLQPRGNKVLKVIVPRKLLAVCSGLAEYGRNNISYVKSLGSYHRLTPFCSDLPCEQDEWCEQVMMEQCRECDICRRACPSGAILADRFLLNVERCITFWNEKPPEVNFPEWLKTSWHNCLVGCMICQKVCPVNKEVRDWYEPGGEFTEEETGILLQGKPFEEMPEHLQDKLNKFDLAAITDILPRNLKALLSNV